MQAQVAENHFSVDEDTRIESLTCGDGFLDIHYNADISVESSLLTPGTIVTAGRVWGCGESVCRGVVSAKSVGKSVLRVATRKAKLTEAFEYADIKFRSVAPTSAVANHRTLGSVQPQAKTETWNYDAATGRALAVKPIVSWTCEGLVSSNVCDGNGGSKGPIPNPMCYLCGNGRTVDVGIR